MAASPLFVATFVKRTRDIFAGADRRASTDAAVAEKATAGTIALFDAALVNVTALPPALPTTR